MSFNVLLQVFIEIRILIPQIKMPSLQMLSVMLFGLHFQGVKWF